MKKYFLIIIMLFVLSPFLLFDNVYASNSNVNYDEDERNAGFLDTDSYKYCGGESNDKALIKNIPTLVPQITSAAYNTVLVIVPLILVIMGSVDLYKGAVSQNEDEIKKGKTNFMKRLVTGILTFLIVLLVKFFVSVMSKDQSRIVSCIDCFINNKCEYMPGKATVPGEEAPKSNKSNTDDNSNTNTNTRSHNGSSGKF